MEPEKVKPIYFRLPAELQRAIRRDAFDREMTIRDWFRDAAEQKLRAREATAPCYGRGGK